MGLEDRFALTQPGPYDGHDLLDATAFGSLLREYARGVVTAGDAVNIINAWVSTPLNAQEQLQLSSLRLMIDAGITESDKVFIASKIYDIITLGEKRAIGYLTRADLKAKLLL